MACECGAGGSLLNEAGDKCICEASTMYINPLSYTCECPKWAELTDAGCECIPDTTLNDAGDECKCNNTE